MVIEISKGYRDIYWKETPGKFLRDQNILNLDQNDGYTGQSSLSYTQFINSTLYKLNLNHILLVLEIKIRKLMEVLL